MKSMKKLALISLAAVAPGVMAASDTFTSSIVVLEPVSISKTADLDFGSIFTDATTNVTVATTDAGAAAFTINGQTGSVVDVTVDATALMADGSGNDIAVNSIAVDNATPTLTGGTATVKIGGVADIASETTLVAGTYNGTVNITVAYQ
ncbi:conserved hypothetical protein [Vibrio nigripulchritudo MADA3029]|uniref:DUF4402 domain-containing protein n=1 Tax=Vibrio TaxID=662 RepID=UPI0003B1F436|nr:MULTISPECIES: DUF4402 domain-containing protein [Vibrio]KJY80441.1 hypothetical protein TW74_04750 [Vibrio nigripulchritudo]UAB71081.1 DUF4402 domain-containing protein [Vibrio sp. SCSIO 43132]CCN35670.1 conserved hypothetical protein [Vibrio nigripulchritudo AM115]CCN44400.1 conserved hypothetical protein [Vibrio nigripulchritudo FTn2]CCN47121.1 conserved hypothetical protein [Vibrio nigripulchritudo MADA3020]